MTREEAIKRFETLLLHVDTDCVMGMETTEAINLAIKALAQPEIVRCRECKWYDSAIYQSGMLVCAVKFDDDYYSHGKGEKDEEEEGAEDG